jgi:hypothetical protein
VVLKCVGRLESDIYLCIIEHAFVFIYQRAIEGESDPI